MELPSKILAQAVEQLSLLPGVGKRSALRYALQLLKISDSEVPVVVLRVSRLKSDIHYCRECRSISDTPVCGICSNPKRDRGIYCVVENIQEVMAIENTQQYRGLYHVLGGVISPIDGVGINDLQIASLVQRVREQQPREVILALPTTMEGDTTNFYLHKQLQQFPDLLVTTIARGVAIGDNLEYADEVTLGRSLLNRLPYDRMR